MRGCAECFGATTWPANASPPEGTPGTCDFGHGYNAHTWSTTAWIDSFVRLFEIYELNEGVENGFELAVQVQRDWGIFSFEDPRQLHSFLSSAVPDHPLLVSGAKVRLRSARNQTNTDLLLSWARFSEEIRTSNRYFPQTIPDQGTLKDVLLSAQGRIEKEVPLCRARVVGPGFFPHSGVMGAPPAHLATAGRANPVGIPHLYLSFAPETCIYETRVSNHTRVAIGKFHAVRDLTVLNLADVKSPDFFAIEIDREDAIVEQVQRVTFHRYLSALGAELTKPVRSSDEPIDYIPTQYLCELVKYLGMDGILYSSSLHPDGRNLVLFDADVAVCDPDIELMEIRSLAATWVRIDPMSLPD